MLPTTQSFENYVKKPRMEIQVQCKEINYFGSETLNQTIIF